MARQASATRKSVAFSIRATPGSKVFLAGTFNDWAPAKTELREKKGSGVYAASVLLPKGRYEYKFVINGTWCVDPACADWVQNRLGTLNSVRKVE